MADQGGVTKIQSPAVAAPTVRPAGSATGRADRAPAASPGAAGRDTSSQRQWVNLEGKALNRSAPRGTYLNIIV